MRYCPRNFLEIPEKLVSIAVVNEIFRLFQYFFIFLIEATWLSLSLCQKRLFENVTLNMPVLLKQLL